MKVDVKLWTPHTLHRGELGDSQRAQQVALSSGISTCVTGLWEPPFPHLGNWGGATCGAALLGTWRSTFPGWWPVQAAGLAPCIWSFLPSPGNLKSGLTRSLISLWGRTRRCVHRLRTGHRTSSASALSPACPSPAPLQRQLDFVSSEELNIQTPQSCLIPVGPPHGQQACHGGVPEERSFSGFSVSESH